METQFNRIAIGCDHGGYDRKVEISAWLKALGYELIDFGCFDHTSMDYPDVAFPLSEAVAEGRFERGILICTTGIGMSVAANKVKGIRCSLCSDPYSAEMARRHNDANILALSAKLLTFEKTKEIIHIWLHTGFDGALPENERHRRRVQKITEFENR